MHGQGISLNVILPYSSVKFDLYGFLCDTVVPDDDTMYVMSLFEKAYAMMNKSTPEIVAFMTAWCPTGYLGAQASRTLLNTCFGQY